MFRLGRYVRIRGYFSRKDIDASMLHSFMEMKKN